MITVNDSIKNAYNNYTTQRKPYIVVGNNTYYIQNMDLQADCYDKGNIIGNAIAKILKFDIETEYVDELDEFELYDSIWTGNQYESVFLGTFKLYDEEGTDDFFSSVTAYDLLIKFNVQYDPSQMTYPSTIFGLLQNICSQAGVTLENASIVNGTQPLENELFVEGETLKTILNAICQISGTFGMISNDKLKLGLKGTQTITLQKYQISEPEFKRTTQNINQVVLGMTDIEGEEVKYPQDSEITGSIHKLTINNNPFVYTQALREAYIQNIYNQVNGFGYEAMSIKWEGLSYVELGDLLNADGHSSMVLRYNIKSPNGLESTLEAPSIIDSSVEYYENSNSIENRQKRTEYIVDKANQRIIQVVEEIGDRSSKNTTITQDIDTISQQVSESVTLTNELTQNGSLVIEDGFEGNLIKFSIIGNMSLLYPSDDLYPSNDLYPLDSYLIIEQEDGTQNKIHLPLTYLNYLDVNTYDEFVIEKGQAKIIRRVGVNDDGSLYALSNITEEDRGELNIFLTTGYNKIWLESFYDVALQYYAKYVYDNDYTDVFATKLETATLVEQTSTSITQSVNAQFTDVNGELQEVNASLELKLNTDDLTTEINAHADEINLTGYVKMSNLENEGETTINGSNITTGIIKSSNGNLEINLNNGNFTTQKEIIIAAYNEYGILVSRTFLDYDSIETYKATIKRKLVVESDIGGDDVTIYQGDITCRSLTQTSLADKKKNFELYSGALKTIENIDIYKYNLKDEEEGIRKHIGFVIGEEYNYSDEITNEDNTGVDLYSMISMCMQAIKEQQEIINKLQERIEALERKKKNEKNT